MTVFQAFLSGVLQGATEFLPVSSSGHLVIFHRFIRIEQSQLLFGIFLHAGTMLAILIYFRTKIKELFFRRRRLGAFVLLGTIPIAVLGAVFSFWLDETFARLFSNASFAAAMLMLTGLWLFSGEYALRRIKVKTALDGGSVGAGAVRAVVVGAAQAVALLPGISRSGSTISTAAMLGAEREEAVRFSFYLAIPATVGAIVVSLLKICCEKGEMSDITVNVAPVCYAAGTISAALVGIAGIKFLLLALKRQKFYLFGVYCIVVGAVVLLVG